MLVLLCLSSLTHTHTHTHTHILSVVYRIPLRLKIWKNLAKFRDRSIRSLKFLQYLLLQKILGFSVDLQNLTQKNTIKRPPIFEVFNKKMLQKSKIMHQKIKVTLNIKSNKEKPFLSQDWEKRKIMRSFQSQKINTLLLFREFYNNNQR